MNNLNDIIAKFINDIKSNKREYLKNDNVSYPYRYRLSNFGRYVLELYGSGRLYTVTGKIGGDLVTVREATGVSDLEQTVKLDVEAIYQAIKPITYCNVY